MTNPNLESLRRAETDLLFAHLRPGMRVLELGGGNGLQARLLQERGCAVTSLDIPGREQPAVQHFPVQDYDGIHIPAANESFDAIFSASVLEHVRDLPALLAEARRVIAPGGFMLHLVPSPVWRFWTSAARYPFLVSDLFNPPPAPAIPDPRSRLRIAASFVKSLMIEPPHGEYANAFVELFAFREARWRRLFEENGWEVSAAEGNGLFYTGHSTFPDLPIATRRKLAALLGSACTLFVLRPAGGAPG